MEIVIKRPKLHVGQQEVYQNALRFNVLCNGRRWGKSKLAVRLAMDTMLKGYPVGMFVPTHEFSEDFWEEIKERLEPIISYKNESKFILNIKTGGHLKIWSLEKKRAGRGRKYKRAIFDEFAFAKDPKTSWELAVRATLTDMQGDAWFLSTPNGFNNYFHDVFQFATETEKYPNWKSFQMPTSTSPFISESELKEVEKQLDPLTFAQEYLAQFVTFAGKPFAYSFDRNKHVKEFGEPDKKYPLCLSFDFNIDPMTCIVAQIIGNQVRIHDEFKLQSSNTYELCDAIIAKYSGYYFEVTGDASGSSGNVMVPRNINNYTIIKNKLGLSNNQMLVPEKNPDHSNSRVLCNSLLYRHPDYLIHPRNKSLILDLELVEMKDDSQIDKKKHGAHHLDCWRYFNNTFLYKFLKNL